MNTLKSSLFTFLSRPNINNKQYYRSVLYDTLLVSLHRLQGTPQWCYLQPYIQKALECFHYKQALFNNKTYIIIKNKETLRGILYFLSKREHSELYQLLDFIKKV